MARDRQQLVITLSLLTLLGTGIVAVFGEDLRAFLGSSALRSGEGAGGRSGAAAKTVPPTGVP